MTTLTSALGRVRRKRRQILRVALQSGVATLVAYLTIFWIGPDNLSWAVISALLTIGVSSDLSYRNALGRVGGALVGAVFGLAAAFVAGPVLIRLLPAVILANMVATAWPALRFAAVTAAIVALDPDPDLAGALARTGAIVAGTVAGAVASFVIWPVRGRDRTAHALRKALKDCHALLQLIERGVSTDDHHERDEVHARFLRHLEMARSRVRETRFHPKLPSGVRLRDAVQGVESLWHALVILDRAVSEERRDISRTALDRLRPVVDEVQARARDYLSDLTDAMNSSGADPPDSVAFCRSVAHARDRIGALLDDGAPDWPHQARALHAVTFGLNETERQLLHLSRIFLPRDDG